MVERSPVVIEIPSDSDDDQEAVQTPPPGDPLEEDEWMAAMTAAYEAAAQEERLAANTTEAHDGAGVASNPATYGERVPSERTQEALTEDGCLSKILEVYPDIAHEHVRQLHRDAIQKGEKTNIYWCEVIIVHILDDGPYPKERNQRRDLKRKRQPSPTPEDVVTTIWGDKYETVGSKVYISRATDILANEYTSVPKKFISETLKHKKALYHAHVALEGHQQQNSPPYTKVRKARPYHEPSPDMPNLLKELEAAKKKIKGDTDKRLKAEKEHRAEEENERVSRVEGKMADCGCCFTEYPTNRMTFCNSETDTHFFCHECAQSYVKAEIGQGKCRPKCMDTSDCPATFARAQLQAFLDEGTFEVLERFQQQEDLRLAGLEGMEECPFCDFKMICLPKKIDREFRCQHPDCRIVSCRLCRLETHIPLTCQQAAKDKKVDVRHLVEEAMTAALIRECNKCKNKFVKEFGCNKMTCPTCGNVQCYVCSKNTLNYEHFQDRPGKCPLYDNTDARHDDEVKKAEAAALEQVKKDHPELQNEDLKIVLSEAVKQAEKQRIQHGAARVPANYVVPGQERIVGPFAMPPPGVRPQLNVGAPNVRAPADEPVGLLRQRPEQPANPALMPQLFHRMPNMNFNPINQLREALRLPNRVWNNNYMPQAGPLAGGMQHAMPQPDPMLPNFFVANDPVIHQYPHPVVVPAVQPAQPVPQPAAANLAPQAPVVQPVQAAVPAPVAPAAPAAQDYNHGRRRAHRLRRVPVENPLHYRGQVPPQV